MRSNNTADVEANEETPLVRSTSDADSTEESQILDEMDRPWPATFERSISLLSSPIIGAEEVKHFTKSPKPGNIPLVERRRMVRSRPLFSLCFTHLRLNLAFLIHSSEHHKPQTEHF